MFMIYKHFIHNFITFGIPWCRDDDLQGSKHVGEQYIIKLIVLLLV
jgi:hypothetical protein